MNKICINLVVSIFLSCFPLLADDESIQLQWKLDDDETLVYRTVMEQIEDSAIDFDELLELYGNDSDGAEKAREEFEKMLSAAKEATFVTELHTDEDNIIEIEMIAKIDESKTSDESTFHNNQIVLRGSVTKDGAIHSFWLKSRQKNLIALMFELPRGKISIGDSWSLNVNLIENDQNFICSKSSKRNVVKLATIRKQENDLIAVLKYDIEEYVLGTFSYTMKPGETKEIETSLSFKYQGISEFSTTKGRWISYNGIMTSRTTGFITSSSKQRFALILD